MKMKVNKSEIISSNFCGFKTYNGLKKAMMKASSLRGRERADVLVMYNVYVYKDIVYMYKLLDDSYFLVSVNHLRDKNPSAEWVPTGFNRIIKIINSETNHGQ